MSDQQSALKAMPVVAAVTTEEMRQRIRRKSRLKGRQVDDAALAEVRALLGEKPASGWRRDRLIDQGVRSITLLDHLD